MLRNTKLDNLLLSIIACRYFISLHLFKKPATYIKLKYIKKIIQKRRKKASVYRATDRDLSSLRIDKMRAKLALKLDTNTRIHHLS